MDKELQQEISKLQFLENSYNNLIMQKRQLTARVNENKEAIEQLKNTSESYLILGNIMIKKDKEDLSKDLENKNASFSKNLEIMEKREVELMQKKTSMQKELFEKLKSQTKGGSDES